MTIPFQSDIIDTHRETIRTKLYIKMLSLLQFQVDFLFQTHYQYVYPNSHDEFPWLLISSILDVMVNSKYLLFLSNLYQPNDTS